MTQDISALMDGELESHESDRAIQACCRDEQSARTWHEYHFIGEAMRQQAVRPSRVAERVMESLRAEPTVLAPRPRAFARVARVALAAAASVATVAVVGWIGFTGSTSPTASTVAVTPAQPEGIQAVVHNAPPAGVPAASRNEIHDYLAAHRQTASPESYRPVASTANAARP